MSLKIRLAKIAIKSTPKSWVLWLARQKLKGIAEVTDFNFDLDARTAFVQVKLNGEDRAIDLLLEGFCLVREGEVYQFSLQRAQSNRLWLDNVLSHVVGKTWKIPKALELDAVLGFVSELLQANAPVEG